MMHALSIAVLLNQAVAFRLLPKSIGKIKTAPVGIKDGKSQESESNDRSGASLHSSASSDRSHARVQADVAEASEAYKHALDILSSAQSSPSCYRIATSDLLDSCHALDGSSADSEQDLEFLKSIYAARLAFCEMEGAGSSLPYQCRTVKATTDISPSQGAKAHLEKCLQALEEKPQSWTSYSNSKQNALTLCKAVRADIDKGGQGSPTLPRDTDSVQMT